MKQIHKTLVMMTTSTEQAQTLPNSQYTRNIRISSLVVSEERKERRSNSVIKSKRISIDYNKEGRK